MQLRRPNTWLALGLFCFPSLGPAHATQKETPSTEYSNSQETQTSLKTAQRTSASALDRVFLMTVKVQDPAGLLAGPSAKAWEKVLADKRWLAPYVATEKEKKTTGSNDASPAPDQQPDIDSESWRHVLSLTREIVFYVDRHPGEQADANPSPRVLRTSGLGTGVVLTGEGVAAAMHSLLGGDSLGTANHNTGETRELFRAGDTYYFANPTQCVLYRGPANQTGLVGFEVTPHGTLSAVHPTLESERRGDDLEVFVNLSALIDESQLPIDAELQAFEQDIRGSLRGLSWAFLGGTIDGAGRWNGRAVLPYDKDSLAATVLGFLSPLREETIQRIPNNALQAFFMSLDVPALLDWIEEEILPLWGADSQEIEEGKLEFKKETGLRLREDVLDQFGPSLTWFHRTSETEADRWMSSFGIEVVSRPKILHAMETMNQRFDIGLKEEKVVGSGVFWKWHFLWTSNWLSLGHTKLSYNDSRPIALASLGWDKPELSKESLATEPFWRSVPHLANRSIVQAHKGRAHHGALLEVFFEFADLKDPAAQEALGIWASLLSEHWASDKNTWSVVQIANTPGRLEARASTH